MSQETPFDIVTRHLVMEKDLNAFGNLFGGNMLAWIDEASALYVMEQIGFANFVTVSFDDVNFKAPARRGDQVYISCRILKTGRSSITVETIAEIHAPVTGSHEETIRCKVTFVCLTDNKPFAYFESEDYKKFRQQKTQA
ncbi:MAG TPA: acyl-CoA thioesterase [Leptospiraceae bacterium]|nr:acyl-CoA thioesterase [Leptospiraceae bacterium]HMW60290.1 acyl-CoA thioesterase [Leptospiraceae bacterium]HMX56408.1 acyl-CoA thioesterase [Leptospiraceae bacterium]HMY44808.1 acyl-CoA thioesterase [Leptospiraceae bacterium]HNE25472.1 acyl-CoA thioesterase [Leptospiraceae bacterium]